MSWTALVPLKQSGPRKTRLDARLSPPDRARLADRLARHVLHTLRDVSGIASVALLSEAPLPGLDVGWIPDLGRGLNQELEQAAAALCDEPLIVVLADLPWLSVGDIEEMLQEASIGASIAPDRHGLGTNALALLRPAGFRFSFGPASFATHREAIGSLCAVVCRDGLAFDIDTPQDLHEALAAGLVFEEAR